MSSTLKKRNFDVMARREAKSAWIFLAPALILYFIYVLFPIGFSFYLSFTDWDGLAARVPLICTQYEDVSCFENYRELFQDSVFWTSLKNNFLWLVFYGLSPLIGLALAFFFHVDTKIARFYKSLIFMPMVFSLVVVGTIWGWFLQPEFGLVEFLLKKVGLLAENEQFGLMASPEWANAGLIVTAIWPHAAYCMVLYLAGLSGLQKNVIEAAQIDGANKWQLFWHVILPMLRPATVIVVIVTMIGALRIFDLVAIMTAGGPSNSTNVLAHYMYEQTFRNLRYGYGAAIAVILFCISLGLILLYLNRITRKN